MQHETSLDYKRKDSYQRQCQDGWFGDGGVAWTRSWPSIVLLLDSVAACYLCELEEQAWLKDLQGDSFRLFFSPSQPAMKMPAASILCNNNSMTIALNFILLSTLFVQSLLSCFLIVCMSTTADITARNAAYINCSSNIHSEDNLQEQDSRVLHEWSKTPSSLALLTGSLTTPRVDEVKSWHCRDRITLVIMLANSKLWDGTLAFVMLCHLYIDAETDLSCWRLVILRCRRHCRFNFYSFKDETSSENNAITSRPYSSL